MKIEPMDSPKMTGKQKAGIAGGSALGLILAAVFAVEGGYVNDPSDPGGETNHGITKNVARGAGYKGSMKDLNRYCANETDICAESILRRQYVERPGFMPLVVIDPAVAEEVIDTAVNMGPPRPSRWFQLSVNRVCNTKLAADGRIGPITVQSWADCRAYLGPPACVRMLNALDGYQEAEYDRLVRINPTLKKYRRGWQNHRIGNVSRARCHVVA